MAVEIRVPVDQIPLGGMKQGESGDDKVLFVRDADGVRAFQAKCPHYGAPLAKGEICAGRLYCPWHKAVFSITEGELLEPPALQALDRYPVRIDGNEAVATLERLERPTPRRSGQERHVVIVGAGAAAVAAVTTLRAAGFAGAISLIGREPSPPYDRTMLSKKFLAKDTPAEQAWLEPDFFASHDVARIEGAAGRIDPATRTVTLEDGRSIEGDALLIATGSRAVVPDFEGKELDGVLTLRSLDDAVELTTRAGKAKRLVVVGGGFIGLEAAAFLTKRGLEVTVVSREALPFGKRFGEAVAAGIKAFHEKNGVQFRTGQVARFVGESAVEAVELDDGSRIETDLVLIGAGAAPETGVLSGISPREDGGIEVSSDLSIAENVWLAGDIAAFPEKGSGETARIEHWRLAQQHGTHVAHAVVSGRSEPFSGTPFFWSNQGEKRFDYGGYAPSFERVVLRGDPSVLDFIAFYVKDGQAAAASSIGRNLEFIAFLHLLDQGRLPPVSEIESGADLTALV